MSVKSKSTRRTSAAKVTYATIDKFAGISAQLDKVAMNTANSPMDAMSSGPWRLVASHSRLRPSTGPQQPVADFPPCR